MDTHIRSLVKLQDLDAALIDLRKSRAALAPKRDALQKEIAALLASHEEAKKSLSQALLERKSLEGEADAKDQLARKHAASLNAVKGNDAYKALLSEIDAAKKEKSQIEDRILELMEKIESLQNASAAREKKFAADRSSLDARVASLDAEAKAVEDKIAAETADRDAFRAGLAAQSVARYDHVRRGREDFLPMAPVDPKTMSCGGCHTKLTPDLVNSALKGHELVSCESCSRLLYVPASEPTPAAAHE